MRAILWTFVIWTAGCTCRSGHLKEQQRHGLHAKHIERLAGDIDVVPSAEILARGKVLISYSDCFACHKASDKKRGPAFGDIAAKYPMNSTYIRVLAKRVMLGTTGTWGNTVMPAHPTISDEEAAMMVMYILHPGSSE